MNQFRTRVDAILKKSDRTRREKVREPSGLTDLHRYTVEATAWLEKDVSDLHSVEPPDEFRERWQEYLALVDESLSMFRMLGDELDSVTDEEEILQISVKYGDRNQLLEERGHEIERELGLGS